MQQTSTPPADGTTRTRVAIGQVLKAVSGTRPISVTVARVADDGAVTMRCNADWSFQGGSEFTVSADKFPRTIFGAAAVAA